MVCWHGNLVRALTTISDTQYVVAGLNDFAELGWASDWQWSAAQYGQYLDLAASSAQEWNTTPDVIERALFERGKHV